MLEGALSAMGAPRFSHVAFLVPSVDRSAVEFTARGFPVGPAEIWEGEGTREVYIGEKSRPGALLLIEAIRDGAYARAIAKRGPGLHHIAIDVVNLEAYLEGISGSGWLLHPKSLGTIRKTKTAYLARPGIPSLIEVQERSSVEGDSFVTAIDFSAYGEGARLFDALGIENLFLFSAEESAIRIGNRMVSFRDIIAAEDSPTAEILRIDHAQISIPRGEESAARSFYVDFLGLRELPKPEKQRDRGGFWLAAGNIQVHVGAEDGFDRLSTKAHLAYRVRGLSRWKQKIVERGLPVKESIPIPGADRFEFRDPFGNRVEFIEWK
jgi:catechol 2,3-dioxygenase-like lactoylglutathione lyase family enzyme